jgi:hypothetical protein
MTDENEIYIKRFEDQAEFSITLQEARILNQWLRLHHGLFKDLPEHIHLLRLINGIGTFVDQYDRR